MKSNKHITFFKRHLDKRGKMIDTALERYMPAPSLYPEAIHKAMRYAVFPGGKRMRAVFTLESAYLFSSHIQSALLPACAVELLHNYSLIHDDLPCMDNDAMRRGKPTVHKKFGEAIALLAGDALLTLSFELISQIPDSSRSSCVAAALASSAGSRGMIGGQIVDIHYAKRKKNKKQLEYIHMHKTAKLITAAFSVGAIAVGAPLNDQRNLDRVGQMVGYAFQLTDDIIDNDGYCALFGRKKTQELADSLTDKALKQLKKYGKRADLLYTMISKLAKRTA